MRDAVPPGAVWFVGFVLLAGFAVCRPAAAGEPRWNTLKSKHVVVHYADDGAEAREVAWRAEQYYDAIARDLGFRRMDGSWLWERRVSVRIYPNAATFVAACQAPAWAAGKADMDRREIAGYHAGGKAFVDEVLPHEMAHFILSDFAGADRVPLWVAEGFAQWEQAGRRVEPPRQAGRFSYMPFATWAAYDVRREVNAGRAALYYQQAASVVGFMILAHGGERFASFCRALRDGRSLDRALGMAYPGEMTALSELEERWIRYAKGDGNP